MDVERIASFVAVVEAGSITRAADRLGAPLSTVSRHITDLERWVGAALLVRTGRGARPTPAGERFLPRARAIVRELELASAEAREEGDAAASVLRLSVPPDLSLRVLPAALAALAARYPGLRVNARADTRRVSLLEEGYDAVIRLGPLDDSELLARRLGVVSRLLCAHPAVACGLRSPEDLAGRPFVRVHGIGDAVDARWRGRAARLDLRGPLRVSTFAEAAEIVALDERSVALLPGFAAAPGLAAGRIARALPDLVFTTVDVRLVHVRSAANGAVLRDLGDLVAAGLAETERALERGAAV